MAHVLLPCDLPFWPDILLSLFQVKSCKDSRQLIQLMTHIHHISCVSLDPEEEDVPQPHLFQELEGFLRECCSEEEVHRLLCQTLPAMASSAASLPRLRPADGLFYSLSLEDGEFHMDRELVASLLSNAFFSTLPRRNSKTHPTLQDFNFVHFFPHLHKQIHRERLKAFFQYFDRVASKGGYITLIRKVGNGPSLTNWLCCNQPLGHFSVRRSIDLSQDLQVYPTCAKIGGDVLKTSTSIESELFFRYPELIVILCVTETLADSEVLIVKGIAQDDTDSLNLSFCFANFVHSCRLEEKSLLSELNKSSAAFCDEHNMESFSGEIFALGSLSKRSSQDASRSFSRSSQDASDSVSKRSSFEASGSISKKLSQECPSKRSSQDVPGSLSKRPSQDVPGSLSKRSSQDVPGSLSRRSSQDVPGSLSKRSSQDVPGSLSRRSSQDATKSIPKKYSLEESSGNLSKKSSFEASSSHSKKDVHHSESHGLKEHFSKEDSLGEKHKSVTSSLEKSFLETKKWTSNKSASQSSGRSMKTALREDESYYTADDDSEDGENPGGCSYRSDSVGFVLGEHERLDDFRKRIRKRTRRLRRRSSYMSSSSDMEDISEEYHPEEFRYIRVATSEPSLASAVGEESPLCLEAEALLLRGRKKMMMTSSNGRLKAYSYDGVSPNLPVPFKAKFRRRSKQDSVSEITAPRRVVVRDVVGCMRVMILWLAASVSETEVCVLCTSEESLRQTTRVHASIVSRKWTIGDLCSEILRLCRNSSSGLDKEKIFLDEILRD